jgi:type II secretion system protein G
MYRRLRSGTQGFTLVELLVVIAIIGILVGIIVPRLGTAKSASRDARRVSDLKNIQLALALYYNDNQHYPCRIDITGATNQCVPDFVGNYMVVVPTDPLSGANYTYNGLNLASGSSSCNTNPPVAYHMGAVLEVGGSSLLLQDPDWAYTSQSAYNNGGCNTSSTNDDKFDGKNLTCAGGSPGATDGCYDVANDQ